jgi:hypothetical protein
MGKNRPNKLGTPHLILLEDLEDAEEIRRLREVGEEAIPWEQAKAELRSEGISV